MRIVTLYICKTEFFILWKWMICGLEVIAHCMLSVGWDTFYMSFVYFILNSEVMIVSEIFSRVLHQIPFEFYSILNYANSFSAFFSPHPHPHLNSTFRRLPRYFDSWNFMMVRHPSLLATRFNTKKPYSYCRETRGAASSHKNTTGLINKLL